MAEEMRTEAMELCVTACEKFASSNEVGCNLNKKCVLSYHISRATMKATNSQYQFGCLGELPKKVYSDLELYLLSLILIILGSLEDDKGKHG